MRFTSLILGLAGCMEYGAELSNGPEGAGDDVEALPPGAQPPDAPPPPGYAEDTFDLPPSGGAIDVIVFGDTSSSMEDELRTLGATITPFVERLADQVADWQLAAVTGDTGCAVNGILTPDTPDFAAKFADGIVTPTATEEAEEYGFMNAAIAVEQSDGGCNDGLVRGDLLHIVFVSDENDESPGFDDGDPDYWTGYLDRIAAVHGDPSSIVMSAVAGPVPNGCDGADPGEGYDRAVAATGGGFLSMCSDWADDIEVLVDAGTTRDRFVLSQDPVADTIEVRVNGVSAPEADWEYLPDPNEVRFLADPPEAGDHVEIWYVVAP